MTTKVTETGEVWTIAIDVEHIGIQLCRQYDSKGESLRRADINRITKVLRQIADSEPENTTEGAKRVIQAASKELERIERRMALLEKIWAKIEKSVGV